MSKIPVIIDCDPGHDDAFAIMMALASDQIDLKAITTTCGNSTLENVTKNALNLLSALGRKDIPVAMGCADPMLAPLDCTPGKLGHGESGMDGPVFPAHDLKPVDKKAVDLMADILRESEEKVVIAALGPLCNIALLFICYPELKEKIAYLSIMGGSLYEGNVTGAAEYNIWVDPESAHVVFESGVPFVLHSTTSTQTTAVGAETVKLWSSIDTKGGHLAKDLLAFYARHLSETFPCNLFDANAVAYILKPELYQLVWTDAQIDLVGQHTRGRTVVELRERANGIDLETYYQRYLHRPYRKNCGAVLSGDKEGFIRLVTESLERL